MKILVHWSQRINLKYFHRLKGKKQISCSSEWHKTFYQYRKIEDNGPVLQMLRENISKLEFFIQTYCCISAQNTYIFRYPRLPEVLFPMYSFLGSSTRTHFSPKLGNENEKQDIYVLGVW